jgi:magnesium chelatase accessory protein
VSLWLHDGQFRGKDWPHRQSSRFVESGGLRWHVQIQGSGPTLLLLHGTGASSHSFRDLMPLLADRYTVVAPDLPGHAFSTAPPPFVPSLPGIAAALAALLTELELAPAVAVGHSAGAAVLARMVLDRTIKPRLLVGLGAALVPFRGAATAWFAPAARLLAQSGLAAQLIASRAQDPGNVERLVRSTGSRLDGRGIELYQRLARHPGHISGVLAMLARWDLVPLYAELPALDSGFLLLAGESDRAIPLVQQREVAARVPGARLLVVSGTGHLLHEEQPETVANLILDEAARAAAAGRLP